jgi:DNA-binding IclR family transcriptional regulator
MAGGASERGRSVASRVTAILTAFGSGGTHSLTELAGLAGLPISTTHRLVGELVSRRVIERTEGGRYRVGLPLRMIGGGLAGTGTPLLEPALNVIEDVVRATGSAARVGILDGTALSVAESRPGHPRPRAFTPDPTPAHASALGRALLAFSPAEVVDAVLAAARGTGTPPMSPERLNRILAGTRLARMAVCQSEDGLRCAVAVPVFGTGGAVLAALEAPVKDVRSGYETVRGALLIAAGSLSRQLATTPADAPPSSEEEAAG